MLFSLENLWHVAQGSAPLAYWTWGSSKLGLHCVMHSKIALRHGISAYGIVLFRCELDAALLQHLCYSSTSAMTSAQPASHHGPHRAVRSSGSGSRCTSESSVPPRSPGPTSHRSSGPRALQAGSAGPVSVCDVRECGSGRERCAGCVILFTIGDSCTTVIYGLHSIVTLARPPRGPASGTRQRHPTGLATRAHDIRSLSAERIREQAPGAMTSLGNLSHATRYPCSGRWASALSDPYLVPLEPPHSGTAVFTNRLMLPAGCLAPLFGTGHAENVRVAARSSPTPFACMRRFTR